MRTAITVILYGLALVLALAAVVLAGYGYYMDRQALTGAQDFATVGAYIGATRYISTGAVVGVLALALAVAGGRARVS